MANQNKLKAYVRYDGTGRVIAGGPILQRFKPKVGNWVEIDASECCNYVPTTTTTTTATPTTTTTSTSTSTSTTSTTTTIAVSSQSGIGAFSPENACAGSGTTLTLFYSGLIGNGTALFTDSGLTVPYNPAVYGDYVNTYFNAEAQVCTMSGNVIFSYVPCSSVTTTTTTTAAPVAFLDVLNTSEDIAVLSVTVNGVPTVVAGCCIPSTPGVGGVLSTTQSGSCTIVISYSSPIGNQSIKVTQSGGGVQCQNVIAGGGTLTFTGVNVAGFQNPVIEAQIITC
jgi:hypothetical protein